MGCPLTSLNFYRSIFEKYFREWCWLYSFFKVRNKGQRVHCWYKERRRKERALAPTCLFGWEAKNLVGVEWRGDGDTSGHTSIKLLYQWNPAGVSQSLQIQITFVCTVWIIQKLEPSPRFYKLLGGSIWPCSAWAPAFCPCWVLVLCPVPSGCSFILTLALTQTWKTLAPFP